MNCTWAVRATRLFLLLFSGVVLIFAGCTIPPRLNHMYNSGNASKASVASTAFDGVATTNGGITAKMIATIGSDGTLMQTTDTLREQLHETSFADRVDNKTWISLQADMWKDFGLIQEDEQKKFDELTNGLPAELQKRVDELNEAEPKSLEERTNKVQTIATILQALAQGQAALVKQAADQASSALTSLRALTNQATETTITNSPAAKNTRKLASVMSKNTTNTVTNLSKVNTNQPTVADMLQFLQGVLIEAGRQMATNEIIQTNATALQKQILSQAESSRDPASAYALVAIVGSGLGTNDMLFLDTYLTNLQIALANTLTNYQPPTVIITRTNTNITTNEMIVATEPRQGGEKSAPNHAATVPPPVGEAKKFKLVYTTNVTLVYATNETPKNAVMRYFAYSYTRSSPSMSTSLIESHAGPKTFNLVSFHHDNSFRNYQDKFTNSCWQVFGQLGARLDSRPVKEKIEQQFQLQPPKVAPLKMAPAEITGDISWQTILTNLPAAVNELVSAARDLQVNVSDIQDLLNNTNVINLATTLIGDMGKGNLAGTNAMNILMNAALLDPTVANFFNQKVSTNVWNEFSGIAKDISAQENAAGARLLSFFIQLSQTQTSIYQENARHYTVLGAISTREVQRWSWIGEVYHLNSELSLPMTDASWTKVFDNKSSKPPAVLFVDQDTINAFTNLYNARAEKLGQADRGYSNTWSPNAIFPTVQVTDRILPSLQLLAETAKQLQQGSPSQNDPIGLRNEIAQARLDQGIEILLNSDFMLNYNVRQADSLNRMLLAEMKQHSVTLDGLELQPAEANIRLLLGNSVAFHSTGITDTDIQSIVNAIALSYIAAKQ